MKDRLLAAARPVCQRYGLALVGGHALVAHGLTDQSVEDLRLATAADVPLYDVTDAVARAFEEAGLEARVTEAGLRVGRLLVTDEVSHLPEPSPEHLPEPSPEHLPEPSAGHLPEPSPEHLPEPSAGHLPEPSAGHLPEPSAGHLPEPSAGHLPEPSAGHLPEPSAGHLPEPSAGHLPEPSAGHLPEPSAGHLPEPSAGHLPEPSAGHLPEPSAGHLPEAESLAGHVTEGGPGVGGAPESQPLVGVVVEVFKEALQEAPVDRDGVLVVALADAVGLRMRDLHERGLAEDVVDVAAVSHLYGFRELEGLGRVHDDEFATGELLMRLEYVDAMDFFGCGVSEERAGEIRRFAEAWVEDIKLRRAVEGDIDVDVPDVPEVD